MSITEHEQNGIYIFAIEGRIDTEGANEMDDKLQAAATGGKYKMILDMAKVPYISSNGLRTMADILTTNQDHDGDLKLVGLTPKVMRVLQIVGFDKFFSFYETVEDATAAFS